MASPPTLDVECALYAQGYRLIAGLDEAGRGAWAGPVVAGAVILPLHLVTAPDLMRRLQGVRDSKQMTPRSRDRFYEVIQEVALAVGVGIVAPACVDRRGLLPATRRAMQQALRRLSKIQAPQHLLLDALSLPSVPLPQLAFPKADARSLTVAAASIIAKVTRDRLMVQLDERFPGYHFARHKGYGTEAHRAALLELGPCSIHRFSYKPVRHVATVSPLSVAPHTGAGH
ncbi:MAG: ribonuclease HII [Anaerolineae bacterium]